VYIVHSYHVPYSPENHSFALATTDYGKTEFLAVVEQNNIFASQFHPEKSGKKGLSLLEAFIHYDKNSPCEIPPLVPINGKTKLAKWIIAVTWGIVLMLGLMKKVIW